MLPSLYYDRLNIITLAGTPQRTWKYTVAHRNVWSILRLVGGYEIPSKQSSYKYVGDCDGLKSDCLITYAKPK